jgi:Ala-tRNA(Pro) deacylase
MMSATSDGLFAQFERLIIITTTHTHPPLFSVEESRKLRGNLPGAHYKNLFLKDKKGLFGWLLLWKTSVSI